MDNLIYMGPVVEIPEKLQGEIALICWFAFIGVFVIYLQRNVKNGNERRKK